MVTGAPFQAGVPLSAAELNKKTITYSDNIAPETPLPGQIFVSTATNGAWLPNDVVMRKICDDGWVLCLKLNTFITRILTLLAVFYQIY